ncbi:MAG: TIM44-like domain-containing protein [Chitinophagaceae bacterium]
MRKFRGFKGFRRGTTFKTISKQQEQDCELSRNQYNPMKLSWNSFKISIAGARLSHLVQKDKIWDHGTMIETVKIIFNQVQSAREGNETQTLSKYMTPPAYSAFKKQLQELQVKDKSWPVYHPVIKEVAVLEVSPAKLNAHDHFTALVRETEIPVDDDANKKIVIQDFSEQWVFVRQGDWWLLDGIRK